jgi:hypothetical protein
MNGGLTSNDIEPTRPRVGFSFNPGTVLELEEFRSDFQIVPRLANVYSGHP